MAVKIDDERFQKLREQTVDVKRSIDWIRVHYLRSIYEQYSGQPTIIKRARLFEAILDNKEIFIDENHFVGSLGSAPGKFYLYPEWGVRWADDPEENFTVPEEYQDDWKVVQSFWKENTFEKRLEDVFTELYSKEADEVGYDVLGAIDNGYVEVKQLAPSGGGNSNYERVINYGIQSIIDEIEERKEKLSYSLENRDKIYFYDAALIDLRAILRLAERYENYARELAAKESSAERKAELLEIADIIHQVPKYPARTFREGLQAQLFVHFALQIEQVGCGFSLGYFGQYLTPLYEADKEAGRITSEEAVYLLQHHFLKLNQIYYYNGRKDDLLNSNDLGQTISIGGYTTEGKDATTELDSLVLDAAKKVRLPQPSIAFFYHNQIQPEFVNNAIDLVSYGTGVPQFMNADVAVQRSLSGYGKYGATIEEARRSCVYGCVTTAIANKTQFYGAAGVNLAKGIELALNDGFDPVTNRQFGPHTGKAEDIHSYEEFANAFVAQIDFAIQQARRATNINGSYSAEITPIPLRSVFVEGSIETGKEIWAGGAKYSNPQFIARDGVDAGNSLAAVDELVFKKQEISLSDLRDALNKNFEDNDVLQKKLLDAPKHGNNDPVAESYVQFAYKTAEEVFKKYNVDYLGRESKLDAYTKSAHNFDGMFTGALPSGRKAGTPLTDGSVSATPGTDVKGPSVLLTSAAKAIDTLSFDSAHLNVKLTPAQFETAQGRAAIATLLKGYFDLGGNHIQFNCVDSKVLKDAQKHPENYKDLVVRVAGFSAYFVRLHEGVQNELIARTEHVA